MWWLSNPQKQIQRVYDHATKQGEFDRLEYVSTP